MAAKLDITVLSSSEITSAFHLSRQQPGADRLDLGACLSQICGPNAKGNPKLDEALAEFDLGQSQQLGGLPQMDLLILIGSHHHRPTDVLVFLDQAVNDGLKKVVLTFAQLE